MRRSDFTWTNESVLLLSGSQDPISAIERLARAKVLEAMDAGWAGPPYNPIGIATLMGIPVEPNVDIADARTISDDGKLKIEFNPTRPRERVRFSLAHEVAHALFPDVAAQTRNRGGDPTLRDDWQLEALCNIAAAEFIMPVGSLPPLDRVPRIEELMLQRRAFDVSAEAFLIRVVKASLEPMAMVIAAPANRGGYRVEYSLSSESGEELGNARDSAMISELAKKIVAIGQTSRAEVQWPNGVNDVHVECVGIPAHPGATLPRVALIFRTDRPEGADDPLASIYGNVLDPVADGMKTVAFLVNDQAKYWGGGVAKAAGQKYPRAHAEFSAWLSDIPKSERLGKVFYSQADTDIMIAAIVAQAGVGPSDRTRLRYTALEKAFNSLYETVRETHASVHMPRLGTGAAGGSWPAIEDLVRQTLVRNHVPVTIYDLPPRRGQYNLGFT